MYTMWAGGIHTAQGVAHIHVRCTCRKMLFALVLLLYASIISSAARFLSHHLWGVLEPEGVPLLSRLTQSPAKPTKGSAERLPQGSVLIGHVVQSPVQTEDHDAKTHNAHADKLKLFVNVTFPRQGYVPIYTTAKRYAEQNGQSIHNTVVNLLVRDWSYEGINPRDYVEKATLYCCDDEGEGDGDAGPTEKQSRARGPSEQAQGVDERGIPYSDIEYFMHGRTVMYTLGTSPGERETRHVQASPYVLKVDRDSLSWMQQLPIGG